MLVDGMMGGFDDVRTTAAASEAAGYDGLWTGETMHDPFLQIVQAAEVTERVTSGTSIAIAFGRTPMTLATTGYDLARYSRGRFVLGLGSQVKPHIERRFSMPWSHPAARMREFVIALRAIWACWQDGTKLDFQGEFYTHTLMTPFFSPPRARVGSAARVHRRRRSADDRGRGRGVRRLLLPPVHHAVVPARRHPARPGPRTRRRWAGHLRARPSRTSRSPVPCSRASVAPTKSWTQAIKGAKEQIAFYASTPAYRAVLEHHGWGDLQPELTRMSKEGRWQEMGDAIADEVLHEFAAVGDVAEVASQLRERWAPSLTRLSFYIPYASDESLRAELLAALS